MDHPGAVDILERGDAAIGDLQHLLLDRAPDPVEDEAGTLALDPQRQHPDPPGEGVERGEGGGVGLGAAADLDHRVVPDRDVEVEIGAAVRAGGGVFQEADADRGAIGGDDRPLGQVFIELGEDLALEIDALRHRLDDEVDVAHGGPEIGLVAEAGEGGVGVGGGPAALGDEARRESGLGLLGARQRGGVEVVDRDREAAVRDLQGDLPPHRPRADDRHARDCCHFSPL